MAKKISILFSCIGRRVSLLKSFKAAARQLKLEPCIIGTDVTQLSAALALCDKGFVVNPVGHREYLGQLLDIVVKCKVNLFIPTTDLDLKLLAVNKSRFAKLGCEVMISSPDVIDICQDKRETFDFLLAKGFDTPDTISTRSALLRKKLTYPRFLKPWDGHAGRGTATVTGREEMKVFSRRIPNCIVQEYIDGVEYTCDVFVDFAMKVRTVVPRKRIEIRAGEVSKGQIVKHDEIMSQGRKLVETLGAGPGVITIQLIEDLNGNIKIIEINPRFGGGAPLSIKAGANFPKWILQQVIGREPRIKFDGFKDNLTMLRYDDEVWFK